MSAFSAKELIQQIKIRPGIYDKDALEQPRRDHKHKLWLEVAEHFTPAEEWESYTDVEKEARMDEIAGKWKHLRANFHREIKLQEAGEANKKRKYIYFEEMEFMRPFVGYRMSRNNNSIDSLDDTQDFEDNVTDLEMDALLKSSESIEDEPEVKVECSNRSGPELRSKSKRLIKPTPKALQNKASTSSLTAHNASRLQKDAVIKNFDVLKKTGANTNPSFKIRDGDISFCLSLVPTLRKLGDGRKLRAKIEILKVLHRYVDHIERRNLVNRTNNANQGAAVNDDDMAEDNYDDYEDSVNIKHELHDDPLNGGGGNTKTWWT